MVNVAYMDMPGRIREFVRANEDGSYTVVINSRMAHEQMILSYLHAISHIENDDFESERSATHIEYDSHEEREFL